MGTKYSMNHEENFTFALRISVLELKHSLLLKLSTSLWLRYSSQTIRQITKLSDTGPICMLQ